MLAAWRNPLPIYNYQALSAQSSIVRGTITADSPRSAFGANSQESPHCQTGSLRPRIEHVTGGWHSIAGGVGLAN